MLQILFKRADALLAVPQECPPAPVLVALEVLAGLADCVYSLTSGDKIPFEALALKKRKLREGFLVATDPNLLDYIVKETRSLF